MTKLEAIRAMKEGKKVRHAYFSDNEWVTMERGRLLFEDGVRCFLSEFFTNRDSPGWSADWEIVQDVNQLK